MRTPTLLRGSMSRSAAERAARAVRRARDEWTSDFGGEQFSLGRAFYTHLEEDRTREYFRDVESSDARVERVVPGLQSRMRALVECVTGGVAVPRRGFCGAGVHIFPAGGELAHAGGVIHFDTEGLAPHHLAARARAITVVLMLQPATRGGGLALWDVAYTGHDHPTKRELAAKKRSYRIEAGDAIAIDSYRLHQIRPFYGDMDRISATIHAVEVDAGRYETWF